MGKWGEPLGGGDESTHVFIGLGEGLGYLQRRGAGVPPEEGLGPPAWRVALSLWQPTVAPAGLRDEAVVTAALDIRSPGP